MILEILLGVSTVIIGVGGYVIWNLVKKTEMMETWVEKFTDRVHSVHDDLDRIDYMGAFQADDDVGTVFEEIKATINELNEFRGKELEDGS
jgi:hypothetical protein